MDSSVFIEDLNCMEEQLVNGEMFRENQKNQLPSNAPVICVHAQNGADLSPEAVDKSFQMAESLFAEYHPNHQYHAYLCCPWLLYPQMKKILPDKSRIRKLAERFRIIGTAGVNDGAI